jgi:ABC-type multidrug transport system ATPase subunit
MLAFENVTTIHRTARGEVRSLDRLNLEVKPGEFVVLRGPSGCGKTTLLLTAGGMQRPTSGRVSLGGRDLRPKPGRTERASGTDDRVCLPDVPSARTLTSREHPARVAAVRRRTEAVKDLPHPNPLPSDGRGALQPRSG